MSTETDSCRLQLAPFCVGNGCDIGFGGGRPIVDSAICIDRELGNPRRRAEAEPWPTHLAWDAFGVLPFASNSLDYIYSSHCLEDADETHEVLCEWNRVLKPGGRIVLFLPDQPTYAASVIRAGGIPNQAHKHAEFSLAWIKPKLPSDCRIIYECWPFPGNAYSFALVTEKSQ